MTVVICHRKARDLRLSRFTPAGRAAAPSLASPLHAPRPSCVCSPRLPLITAPHLSQSPCPLHVTAVLARADPRGLCRSLPGPPRPFPGAPTQSRAGAEPRSWVGSPGGSGLSRLPSQRASSLPQRLCRRPSSSGWPSELAWPSSSFWQPSWPSAAPAPREVRGESRELGEGDRAKGQA